MKLLNKQKSNHMIFYMIQAFALLISVIFQVLQAYHQPYKSALRNRVADATSAALSLMYFIGLLIQSQSSPSDNLGALCVALILLLIGVALAAITALVALRKQVALRPHRQKQDRQGSAAVSLSEPLLGEAHE